MIMFGHSSLRAPPSRLSELVQSLRDLEGKARRLDFGDVPARSTDLVDTVSTALEDIANRFRSGAGHATREAGRLGQRASAAGRDSFELLKSEVDAHPLVMLGVAAGIGILIGASLYQRSRTTPPQPKPRRRIKRRARK
jgi:ElaB/YqjD/DUF883 family membrane-anchored ribosome-binding protein